jgi:putative glycosyltransferase (TIGR04372 family)
MKRRKFPAWLISKVTGPLIVITDIIPPRAALVAITAHHAAGLPFRNHAVGKFVLSRLRAHRCAIVFLLNIIFVFLPFKALLAVTILVSRVTNHGYLDYHFVKYCAHNMRKHLRWVVGGPLSRRFPNDVFFCLISCGHYDEALALFPRIDLEHCDGCFTERLTSLPDKISSGYAMYLLVQLQRLESKRPTAEVNKMWYGIVKGMLDHRNFGYEERIFRDNKDFADDPDGVPLDTYVPHFFQDKDCVKTLVKDLSLGWGDELLDSMDDGRKYWESVPYEERERHIISDINLFYAYRHLLLRTYHCGEGRYVPRIYQRSLETQKRLKLFLPSPSVKLRKVLDDLSIDFPDIKLLCPDWTALIGHNGHLGVHLMMRQMGWWHGSPVLVTYNDRIANRPFFSLFNELCPTLVLGENISSDAWHELASLAPFFGVSHQAFGLEDGRTMYWNDAGAMALQQWESAGGGFPLRNIYDCRLIADDEPDSTFSALRRKWGMGPDDWHVCLHMRDTATRNERQGAGEAVRSTSFENYVDAIRYITDQGGWVLRMGGPKAPAIPKMPRLIDYARSEDQTPVMDIHLVRRARMFIGTTSGFAYVASSFGIPTAMVNAISSVGLLWSRDTRFTLKPIRTRDGRLLSQREITSEQWRWSYPTYESLARAGLTVTENSPDEIMETAKEALELGARDAVAQTSPLVETWRNSLTYGYFYGSATPSRYFLEKYANSFLND